MRHIKKLAACIVLLTIVALGTGFSETVVVPGAEVQKFVRSVAVQVLVNLDKYTRSLTWYQEVTADGQKGEWKCKYGDWSKPERIAVAGSGVIIFSDKLPIPQGNVVGATIILTNAHVVEYLVKKEALGSAINPFDVYDESDLIISTYPPSVKVREGARPKAQQYFVLPANYVTIKHREDQTYEVRGKVIAFDKALDVALIQLDNVWGLPYATFRETPAQVGEEVWICGAPLALPFSIDRGRINQVKLDLGESGGILWNRQLKLDIAAAPGSSGSGIFDINGYLIGCLHGVLVYQGNYIRGGQLAIDGEFIREWLIWNGYAFIVMNPPYAKAPYVTGK